MGFLSWGFPLFSENEKESFILTDIENSQPFPANVEQSCKTCFKGLSLSKLLSLMELVENSMLGQLLEPGAEVSALARSLSSMLMASLKSVTIVKMVIIV